MGNDIVQLQKTVLVCRFCGQKPIITIHAGDVYLYGIAHTCDGVSLRVLAIPKMIVDEIISTFNAEHGVRNES